MYVRTDVTHYTNTTCTLMYMYIRMYAMLGNILHGQLWHRHETLHCDYHWNTIRG